MLVVIYNGPEAGESIGSCINTFFSGFGFVDEMETLPSLLL